GVGGRLDLVLRVAVAGAAADDLDLQAGRRLAVEQQPEARLLAGEQVVGMGDRHQFDAFAAGLERGVVRRAVGDEGLDPADRLHHLQLRRVLRYPGGEAVGIAAPALALPAFHPAGAEAAVVGADAVGALLPELDVEHAAVLAG